MTILSFPFWKQTFLIAVKSGYVVLKWMLPAVIAVRLLEIWGLADNLAGVFAPFMQVMGLPEWTGLVWVTAILSNLYGGLAILVSSSETSTLSVAQMSILCTVMLVAHSLPVEARITQALGFRFWSMIGFRLLVAFSLGIGLNIVYTSFGLFQESVIFKWALNTQNNQDTEDDLLRSFGQETISLFWLFTIVVVLVMITEILKKIRVIYYCELLMRPLLRMMGLSPNLSHIMAVSGLLGLTYGSGLLIAESRKHNFTNLYVAVAFISICHALIEDTIIMVMAGAHLSAVLFARFFFSLLVAVILLKWPTAS